MRASRPGTSLETGWQPNLDQPKLERTSAKPLGTWAAAGGDRGAARSRAPTSAQRQGATERRAGGKQQAAQQHGKAGGGKRPAAAGAEAGGRQAEGHSSFYIRLQAELAGLSPISHAPRRRSEEAGGGRQAGRGRGQTDGQRTTETEGKTGDDGQKRETNETDDTKRAHDDTTNATGAHPAATPG
mmetsp:Transcript_78189/g.229146  ORF Transcript_78189/g.229146 Transcript_78189/m.229146 type:complete len:185 (+) Transcript_78189:39-593(+)